MHKLKFRDMEYDFGTNLDGYIFAVFLKELLFFGNPENVARVTCSSIVGLVKANAASTEKEFKKAVHKTLRFFHTDKFEDTFKLELESVCARLMRYKDIKAYVEAVARQNEASRKPGTSLMQTIANSITKVLCGAMETGSLLIKVKDEEGSTVLSDFLIAYSASLASDGLGILRIQQIEAARHEQATRERVAREQAAREQAAHESAAREQALRQQVLREQAERALDLATVADFISNLDLTAEQLALIADFVRADGGLHTLAEYIRADSASSRHPDLDYINTNLNKNIYNNLRYI